MPHSSERVFATTEALTLLTTELDAHVLRLCQESRVIDTRRLAEATHAFILATTILSLSKGSHRFDALPLSLIDWLLIFRSDRNPIQEALMLLVRHDLLIDFGDLAAKLGICLLHLIDVIGQVFNLLLHSPHVLFCLL